MARRHLIDFPERKGALGAQREKGRLSFLGLRLLFPVSLRDLFVGEAGDRLQPGRRNRFLERGSTAPFPVRTHGHQLVMHRVLMNVVQASKVTALMGEMSLAKILSEPPAPGSPIAQVHLLRREAVELSHHRGQGLPVAARTMSNKMIVVGQDRPCFQLPSKLLREQEKLFLKPVLPSIVRQQMSSPGGSGSEEIDPSAP